MALRNERAADGATLTRVDLFQRDRVADLSRVLPLLEDLGLRVIEERPTRLLDAHDDATDRGERWLQDFGVLGPDDRALDVDAVGARVAEAIAAALRDEVESDALNRLVVTTALDWRQIDLLRAYRRYRQRIGSRFTEAYQADVLAANAAITAKLVALFELRFGVEGPAQPRDEEAEQALRSEILADLERVPSLDDDRILRNQLGLIDATVRTNAYRPGRGALALKLRSAEVPAIPQPAPLFEVFVYARDVEGIHLRGGRIARGGIRWSDRMDYRTEVLGLMRAQRTKNAIIVPDGAKGGFYLKRPPRESAELGAEVARQYEAYIGALLDVTDDLDDGAIVHPTGVRVLDEDDPYLVVAADKGTARLSDTANRIALERGFWLGDAFASGGSNGYDHKALGITARGAWTSLERHLLELGIDPARAEPTLVGVGDMSGDVFGNAMLLSDRLRLLAAYDHRHVFIDPTPDPAASHGERRRLFELGLAGGSSWDDYDRDLISPGGGVWPRTAKSIALSPEARAVLGIEEEALAPSDVIRAILRAPVDVLFNGGIGTFVKASSESDDDAADRASDAIRVDARDLRCRAVVEGGNLGLTQRARVEYSRGGGLVNADFIDNSAGVDCSDHEVNLKILLDLAVRRGQLRRDERDALLAQVTDDVVAHVLEDSFQQARILAREVPASVGRMHAYEDLMVSLEGASLLDRDLERLPSGEAMADRRRDGRGLERPELAVLLAWGKRLLTAALLRSDVPDEPFFARCLRAYFPQPVIERLGALVDEHPLRRELVATLASNGVVDEVGPTFVARLMAERGADAAAVVRAFWIAREVTGAAERWARIDALGANVERAVRRELLEGVDALVEAVARWYLDAGEAVDVQARIDAAREPFANLRAALLEHDDDAHAERRERVVARLAGLGVDAALARDHAIDPELVQAPDAIAVASASGRPVLEVGRAFARLSSQLRLGWLEEQIAALPTATRSQRWAAQDVRDDVMRTRRELVLRALAAAPRSGAEDAVEALLAERGAAVRRFVELSRSLGAEGTELAGAMLAARELRALAAA